MSDKLLDLIFLEGRTHSHWLDRPVDPALLRQAYDLAKLAPTSANSQPLRIVFITSPAAKARLKPLLAAGNVEKTMAAPVTALFAHDLEFFEQLPRLFPHADARSWFKGQPHSESTAFRNGSLQAGYFMLAARALGLDCGPMSGFDQSGVDREFLAGSSWRSNFLCNLGYGDARQLHPRSPRPDFDDFCKVI